MSIVNHFTVNVLLMLRRENSEYKLWNAVRMLYPRVNREMCVNRLIYDSNKKLCCLSCFLKPTIKRIFLKNIFFLVSTSVLCRYYTAYNIYVQRTHIREAIKMVQMSIRLHSIYAHRLSSWCSLWTQLFAHSIGRAGNHSHSQQPIFDFH